MDDVFTIGNIWHIWKERGLWHTLIIPLVYIIAHVLEDAGWEMGEVLGRA